MKNILLIEDNLGDVRLTTELLREAAPQDFSISTAATLAQGLNIISQQSIDAVLLDLSLPDGYGIETFEKVHRESPQLPIVVLTSLDDNEFGLQAVKQGAQDYLVKGQINAQLLRRVICYAIERKILLVKLEKALADIKTLHGLIPICANCKSIRDDSGYWQQLEKYISEHSEAQFSHGLCPKCIKEIYPEYAPK